MDTNRRLSRRAVFAGSIGAAAALASQALGRPAIVRAGVDGDVVLGTSNSATTTTQISNTSGNTSAAFLGHASGNAPGVYGSSYGWSGVFGYTPGGADRRGVTGVAYGDGTGVVGTSSTAPGSATGPAKTGVFGYAAQDATARGVYGQSTIGRGVTGEATTGLGVRGYATTGTAASFEASGGWALATKGRVQFNLASGRSTISAGTNQVTINPGLDISASSKILATLQGSAGGSTAVRYVARNAAADTFTIVLTGNSTVDVAVAWFVIG